MERMPLTESHFRQLWAALGSIDDLCRQAGISRNVAYAKAREYGLPARPHGVRQLKQVDVPLLFKLWSQPIEIREIAEIMGIRESFVGKLARRYALPARARKKPEDQGMRVNDPTPEEIAERAAWCRARRPVQDEQQHVELRQYTYDDRNGVFTPWVA